MVILQHAGKTLTAVNFAIDASNLMSRFDDAVGQALVIAFLVIVRHEFFNGVSQ